MNIIKLNWNKIDSLIYSLSEEIRLSKFKPDYIICVMRGGMVMSRMLDTYLKTKEILPFYIKTYFNNKRIKNVILRKFQYSFIYHKKVLICDEIVDSGNTLETVLKHVTLFKPTNIEIATIVAKKKCSVNPTYCPIKYIPKKIWIKFPWEIQAPVPSLNLQRFKVPLSNVAPMSHYRYCDYI